MQLNLEQIMLALPIALFRVIKLWISYVKHLRWKFMQKVLDIYRKKCLLSISRSFQVFFITLRYTHLHFSLANLEAQQLMNDVTN